ncbi:hypothetical protein V8D89_011205 [Ganoderma adspersum]
MITALERRSPSRSNATSPDPTVVPIFPALTHLHIVAPNWSPPLLRLSRWIAHTPRVMHLRISAHSLFGKFVDRLPAAVGTPSSAASGSAPRLDRPPRCACTRPSRVLWSSRAHAVRVAHAGRTDTCLTRGRYSWTGSLPARGCWVSRCMSLPPRARGPGTNGTRRSGRSG